jgi:hypothetical protein
VIRVSLCNEVLRELDFPAQCALAQRLGYDGLEIAPFTLSEQPDRLAPAHRAELRRIAEDHSLRITGLHYLLLAPPGLSITSPDAGVRTRTTDVMRALIGLCADPGAPSWCMARRRSAGSRTGKARPRRLRTPRPASGRSPRMPRRPGSRIASRRSLRPRRS